MNWGYKELNVAGSIYDLYTKTPPRSPRQRTHSVALVLKFILPQS